MWRKILNLENTKTPLDELNTENNLKEVVLTVEDTLTDAVHTKKSASLDENSISGFIQLRPKPVYEFFKRLQDIVLSLSALIVLAVPMLILAVIIYIDSPGASPFYVQKRIGKGGKEFNFWKFRSMIPNADKQLDKLLHKNEMDGPVFKMKNDPRITRVGKFIRKTSIDELPQLWNVLKGDMTIVGPRPALPREVKQYGEYEDQRLLVVPGLTCYWQTQPKRNDLNFSQWLELDIKYIKERSFINDWKIIFKTFSVVLSGEGE